MAYKSGSYHRPYSRTKREVRAVPAEGSGGKIFRHNGVVAVSTDKTRPGQQRQNVRQKSDKLTRNRMKTEHKKTTLAIRLDRQHVQAIRNELPEGITEGMSSRKIWENFM